MTRAAAPSSQAGFTLVEALVSLFVFSLIAVGSTALLIQAAQAQRQASQAHEALQALQLTRSLLTGDLAQIAPRAPRSSQTGQTGPRFMGGDAQVALGFVRSGSVAMGQDGVGNSLVYVEYGIEEDRLIRRVRPDLSAPAEPSVEDQVLLEGADNLSFEFFDGIAWRDQWIAVDGGLPRAIALTGEVQRYGAVRIEVLTAETWP